MFVCPDIVLSAQNTQVKSVLLGTFQARGEDNARVRIRAHFTQVVNMSALFGSTYTQVVNMKS